MSLALMILMTALLGPVREVRSTRGGEKKMSQSTNEANYLTEGLSVVSRCRDYRDVAQWSSVKSWGRLEDHRAWRSETEERKKMLTTSTGVQLISCFDERQTE